VPAAALNSPANCIQPRLPSLPRPTCAGDALRFHGKAHHLERQLVGAETRAAVLFALVIGVPLNTPRPPHCG
jgi:hypothetical protein